MPKLNGEYTSDDVRFAKIEFILEQNAESIKSLTSVVHKIADSMTVDAKNNDKRLQGLIIASEKCQERYMHMMERMDDKKTLLSATDAKIHKLHDEQEVKIQRIIANTIDRTTFINAMNRLWWIGGSVMATIAGIVVKLLIGGN